MTNPPHIPDPELAALREPDKILAQWMTKKGMVALHESEVQEVIKVMVTAINNQLIDKVLGLIEDEETEGYFGEVLQLKRWVNRKNAAFRAEVEKLKEE